MRHSGINNKKMLTIVSIIILVALIALNTRSIEKQRSYEIDDMEEPLYLYYTEYQVFNFSVYNFKRINFDGFDYTAKVWKIEKNRSNNVFMYEFEVKRDSIEDEKYSYWTKIGITPGFKQLIVFKIINDRILKTESSETYNGYLISD